MVTSTRTRAIPRGHNLPAPVTSFIGRRRELGDIVSLLDGRGPLTSRLATLTGPGGVGKTRLALEVGGELVESGSFEDGVWLVELAPVSDPRDLVRAIAGVFRLQEDTDRALSGVLVDALRPRQLLLILDNCEHLIAACADLTETLLRGCPRIAVLATSREPLRVSGETMRRVPSLPWQDPKARPSMDQISACDAVRLFIDRAGAASGEFALDERNALLVAQVCARLDGIPLALELAAARTRALSVDQIAARLDDRFRLLGDGSRTAPPRQQTLEATVAWSYDLLDPQERRLLRHLAIFAGGWTLDDAEAVCSGPGGSIRAAGPNGVDGLNGSYATTSGVRPQSPAGQARDDGSHGRAWPTVADGPPSTDKAMSSDRPGADGPKSADEPAGAERDEALTRRDWRARGDQPESADWPLSPNEPGSTYEPNTTDRLTNAAEPNRTDRLTNVAEPNRTDRRTNTAEPNAADGLESVEGAAVLTTLARLVEKSLVVAEDGPGGAKWFRLLETIRQFAAERLRASGEEAVIRQRHFDWYVKLSEDCDRCIRWTTGLPWQIKSDWLRRQIAEHANLRLAWQWALEGEGDVQAGMRLMTSLFPYFWCQGLVAEARSVTCAMVARDASRAPTPARAGALSTAAKLSNMDGDEGGARELAAEYLALPESLKHDSATALVLNALSLQALQRGDTAGARKHLQDALTLVHRTGEFSTPVYTSYLGAVEEVAGDLDAAEAAYDLARRESLAADFPIPMGIAQHGLARVARARGDVPRARALFEEALATLREQSALPREVALALVSLGDLAREAGDLELAKARLGEALEVSTALGNRAPLIAALETIGVLVVTSTERSATEQLFDCARLLGAANGLRAITRLALPAAPSVAQAVGCLRVELGVARVDSLLGTGQYLAAEEAVTLGRAVLDRLDTCPHEVAMTDGPALTRREREVATLVARGASNRQIAETLVIGERTAEMHVSRLLTKLDFASRTQIAAWAAERRLHLVDSGT